MEENERQTKKCPFCGEEININAKKCKFCKNWIDEEILCPYCQEKIKKSAKKCRFCGEWLDKSTPEEDKNSFKNFKFDFNSKTKKIVVISSVVFIIAAVCFLIAAIRVPSCSSKTIDKKLTQHLLQKYSILSDVRINETETVSKNKNGYTCSAELSGVTEEDTVPFSVKYTYTKEGLNSYNFESETILPDCYSDTIKDIVISLIKQSKSPAFISNVDDITLEYATLKKYDEKNVKYSCQATAVMEAKPGKALALYWYDDSARTKVKCDIDYQSLFCGNGITTCAGLNDIYNCKYAED